MLQRKKKTQAARNKPFNHATKYTFLTTRTKHCHQWNYRTAYNIASLALLQGHSVWGQSTVQPNALGFSFYSIPLSLFVGPVEVIGGHWNRCRCHACITWPYKCVSSSLLQCLTVLCIAAYSTCTLYQQWTLSVVGFSRTFTLLAREWHWWCVHVAAMFIELCEKQMSGRLLLCGVYIGDYPFTLCIIILCVLYAVCMYNVGNRTEQTHSCLATHGNSLTSS